MVASFRRRGLDPVVTVTALAEGFGPGWTATEICQLALQALRNQFVQAEDDAEIGDVLSAGLMAANEAIYERAYGYGAEGEIGGGIVVAVIAAGRCLLAQVGGGAAFLIRREGDLEKVKPILLSRAGGDGFLGENTELSLSPTDEKEEVRLLAGDVVVLVNATLSDGLAPKENQIAGALARLPLERAADKLIKLGQSKEPKQELATLLVEMPGAARKAAAILPRFGRPAVLGLGALALIALLFWGGMGWLGWLGEPTPTATPTLSPTATIDLPPLPTDLPLLPTPIRTATPTPTPTETATPSPSPTDTPTPRPPTETAMPTETATATPLLPTATDTLAPSPTVPAAPIVVGGQVVVIGTEGLGMSFRSGPGAGYERLAIIYDGEQLEVIGGPEEEGGFTWWQLRAAGGQEGWGVDRYLQGVATP